MKESPDERLWDTTAPYYHQLADFLESIASEHHHLEIDQPTVERWRDVMGLMREVDTFADESGDHATALEALHSFDPFRSRYPSLSPEIAGDMHTKLLERGQSILALGQHIAQTTVTTDFIRLRVREGMYTAHLFIDTSSPETAEQPTFGNFAHTIRALGASASLLDSAADIKSDHTTGENRLRPSLANRLRLLAAAGYYTKEIAHAGSHWRVMKETIRAAHLQVKRKIHLKQHHNDNRSP